MHAAVSLSAHIIAIQYSRSLARSISLSLSPFLDVSSLSLLQWTLLYRSFSARYIIWFCPCLVRSPSLSLAVPGLALPARARSHTCQPLPLMSKIHTSDKALWNGVCVNWSEISVHRTTSLSHSKFYCTCGKTNLMLDLLVNEWEVDKAKNIYNNSNNNGNHDYHNFWTRAFLYVDCFVAYWCVCTRFYVFFLYFMCERVGFVYLSARSVFTVAVAYVCVWQQHRLRIQLKLNTNGRGYVNEIEIIDNFGMRRNAMKFIQNTNFDVILSNGNGSNSSSSGCNGRFTGNKTNNNGKEKKKTWKTPFAFFRIQSPQNYLIINLNYLFSTLLFNCISFGSPFCDCVRHFFSSEFN